VPVKKEITEIGCGIVTCPASKNPLGEDYGEWDWALWFVKYSPVVDVVLTTFAPSFPDPVLLLDLTNTANSIRTKNLLAQHSRLVCIQEIIRRCSRESSSPREHFSLLYHVSSPMQPTVSSVLVFLLTMRRMSLSIYPPFADAPCSPPVPGIAKQCQTWFYAFRLLSLSN
jgi:hypothetical protein